MNGEDASPVENAKRKAAANAFLNLSKKSSSKMKRVTSLLRKRHEDKQLTEDELQFLADNPKLVDQFNVRREKRKEYQSRHLETEDSPQRLREKCSQLAQAIHDAEFLVVYTGAGISTAASIPDYRGPNGIWTRLQKGEDIGSHDLTEAEPTVTHMALSCLQQCSRLQHIVSQNCDGLHLRSGLPKTALSEVHGNMYIEVCKACVPAREYVRTFDVTERTSTYKHTTGRRCYRCGEPLLDSIVHFGERGKLRWPLNWQGACQAANAADTILCLGSSLKVLKKYTWLWQMDRPTKRRPRLFIINLQWTPKDKEATLKINGKCDEVMQLVMKYLGLEIPCYNRYKDTIFSMATPLHPDELNTTTRPCLLPPQPTEGGHDSLEVDARAPNSSFTQDSNTTRNSLFGNDISKNSIVAQSVPDVSSITTVGNNAFRGGLFPVDDSKSMNCVASPLSSSKSSLYSDGIECKSLAVTKLINSSAPNSMASYCDSSISFNNKTVCIKNSVCFDQTHSVGNVNNRQVLLRTPDVVNFAVVASSQRCSSVNCDTRDKISSTFTYNKNNLLESFHDNGSSISTSDSPSLITSRTCVATPGTARSVVSDLCKAEPACVCSAEQQCVTCRVRVLCSSQLNDETCCKCELVLRKLFANGASEKLLQCQACGNLLRFFLLGTCRRNESKEVVTNPIDDACSITELFCHCLDGKLPIDKFSSSLSETYGPIVSDLFIGSHDDHLIVDQRKRSLQDQQTKIELLLGLSDVKNEPDEDTKCEMKVKNEVDCKDNYINHEVIDEQKIDAKFANRQFMESKINDKVPILVNNQLDQGNSSELKNRDNSNLTIQSSIKHESDDSKSVDGTSPIKAECHEKKDIIEICLDDTDSSSLPTEDEPSPRHSEQFYGTGLCIRSTFDSCNESSSQDDDNDMSELDSLEDGEDVKDEEDIPSDMEDDDSDDDDTNDQSEAPRPCLIRDIAFDENVSCDSTNASSPSSGYKTLNLEDIMEIASNDSVDKENDAIQEAGNDVRWKIDEKVNLMCENYDNNSDAMTKAKTLVDEKNSIDVDVCVAVENLKNPSTSNVPSAASSPLLSKLAANGLSLNVSTSEPREEESEELKSIWFKSFCGPRSNAGALSDSVPSKTQLLLLSQVKDLVGKNSVDDNIKKLWFWGFDDAMIKQRSCGGSNGVTMIANKSAMNELISRRSHYVCSGQGVSSVDTHMEGDDVSDDCGEGGQCDDSTAADACDTHESPPRRVTRSHTRPSQDKSSEDEDEPVCFCGGDLNPALCEAGRGLRRPEPDEDMLRARAVIARRRTINYKRFEPVFAVKLKSLVVENGKRKCKTKQTANLDKAVKIKKVESDEEEELDLETKPDESLRDGSEEETDKVMKKITPGWYGKGFRKMIRKKVPKSYPLK